VDIQTASAIGAFIWSADTDRGGNVGMQQFAEIAERTGNPAGIISVGCDGYGAEWSEIQRQSSAEGAIAERDV